MAVKIGPKEQALRDARVRRFEDAKSIAAMASPDALREKIASVPARKPKMAKKKRR
ncbi:MAG: hypothetical protein KGL39_40335 [Patescibacteria group bacterium]|nr:hypothetical protein [Patescibacteria group bacterium]